MTFGTQFVKQGDFVHFTGAPVASSSRHTSAHVVIFVSQVLLCCDFLDNNCVLQFLIQTSLFLKVLVPTLALCIKAYKKLHSKVISAFGKVYEMNW